MTTSVSLGTIPRWIFNDPETNTPAVDGYFYPKRANDKSESKPIYKDPAGVIPYPLADGATRLDGGGGIGPIYWLTDEPYYIEVRRKSASGEPGEIIFKMDDYIPEGEGGGPVSTTIDIKNYIINPQFTYNYGSRTELYDVTTESVIIAEGQWYLEKDSDGVTDQIDFNAFLTDQTVVEGNPSYYLDYTASSATTPLETYKRLISKFEKVQTFSDQTISVSFEGASDSVNPAERTIEVSLVQNYGAGGSVETVTDIGTIVLGSSFTTHTIDNVSVPISTGTVGTDPYFGLAFRLPLNTVSNVKLVNVQFQRGAAATTFEFERPLETKRRSRAGFIPQARTNDVGKSLVVTSDPLAADRPLNTSYLAWGIGIPAGTTIIGWNPQYVPDGWLPMEGQLANRGTYPDLYNAWKVDSAGGEPWSYTACEGFSLAWGLFVEQPLTVGTTIEVTLLAGGAVVESPVDGNGGGSNEIGITIVALPDTGLGQKKFSFAFTKDVSSMDADPYFTFGYSVAGGSKKGVFWLNIDGQYDTSVPSYLPGGYTPIKVNVDSTDTILGAAQKIADMMWETFFYIPDTRGVFFRGMNGARTDTYEDPNKDARLFPDPAGVNADIINDNPALFGGSNVNTTGTYQVQDNKEHNHALRVREFGCDGTLNPIWDTPPIGLDFESNRIENSGTEARPNNMSIRLLVKT